MSCSLSVLTQPPMESFHQNSSQSLKLLICKGSSQLQNVYEKLPPSRECLPHWILRWENYIKQYFINDILHIFKITIQSLPFPVNKRGKGSDWIVSNNVRYSLNVNYCINIAIADIIKEALI